MERAKLKQSRQVKDNILNALVWAAAALTVGFLFWIIWYILSNGLQHVDWNFISDNYTRTGEEHGIFPMIISTIYMVVASIAVAAPLGIMTAIYLTEYAKVGSRLVKVIRFCTESLAGIPSIIFGLFGMTFFVAILGLGFSILSGGLNAEYSYPAGDHQDDRRSADGGTTNLPRRLVWSRCIKNLYHLAFDFAECNAWYFNLGDFEYWPRDW